MIHTISVLGGHGRSGAHEDVERIDFRMGDVVSVVGPTGSGKTTLINDIELLADANTPTGRRVLINGAPADSAQRDDPARNQIALITQHTTFLSDLSVRDFLNTQARVRTSDASRVTANVERTLAMANELTGEPIRIESRMTELSGGQTRALLIADATVICDTPIVLLDEVENAGIHRNRALELLRAHKRNSASPRASSTRVSCAPITATSWCSAMPCSGRIGAARACCSSRPPGCVCAARPTSITASAWSYSRPPAV